MTRCHRNLPTHPEPSSSSPWYGVSTQSRCCLIELTLLSSLTEQTSWTGGRTLYRLVIDNPSRSLHIVPTKAQSPRPGKSSSFILAFAEITALEFGRANGGAAASSSRSSLFRSSSVNSDGLERPTVSIVTSTSKKNVEFDMRSLDERAEFSAAIGSAAPGVLRASLDRPSFPSDA